MKWLAEINGSKLFVRNYVELARGESSPESALKVIYNIIVPENCPVQIKDYFGSIDVKNLKAGLKIDSEYSRIELENIKGGAIIQTLFGDISCTGIGGAVSVTSNRSNITFTHISGNIEINASVAKIKLGDFDNVKKMKIKAEKSVIDLSIPDYNQFAFHVDLSDCEFIKPDKIITESSKNAPSNIKANFQINSDKPLVSIVLNYGYLTINQ